MGLVPATSPCNKSEGLVAKMASSHNATSPCDLLQGIVAGTSLIVCANLNNLIDQGIKKPSVTIKKQNLSSMSIHPYHTAAILDMTYVL